MNEFTYRAVFVGAVLGAIVYLATHDYQWWAFLVFMSATNLPKDKP